jgi:hypothetical protein
MRSVLLLATVLVASSVLGADWELTYRPAKTEFVIYGGGLGDPQAPTKTDRKLSVFISGDAAAELFNSIGPDRRNACIDRKTRFRERGGISCSLPQGEQPKCYLGLDLSNGKAIPGAVC